MSSFEQISMNTNVLWTLSLFYSWKSRRESMLRHFQKFTFWAQKKSKNNNLIISHSLCIRQKIAIMGVKNRESHSLTEKVIKLIVALWNWFEIAKKKLKCSSLKTKKLVNWKSVNTHCWTVKFIWVSYNKTQGFYWSYTFLALQLGSTSVVVKNQMKCIPYVRSSLASRPSFWRLTWPSG